MTEGENVPPPPPAEEFDLDPESVADEDVLVCIDEEDSELYAVMNSIHGKKRSCLPWIILFLLLLAGAAFAAWWFHFRHMNKPSEPEPEKTEAPKEKTKEEKLLEATPEMLRARRKSLRLETAKKFGGSEETEKAVDSALGFMARTQSEDGHWDSRKFGSKENADVGLSGLALLAFTGAGQTAREGDHQDQVKKAAEFLMSCQDDKTGRIWRDDQAGYGVGYHHAICGMALAELAALDKNEKVLAAAKKAVHYSVAEHPYLKDGKPFGWRYNARQWPDTSVTGWFVMQLKVAPEAGIEVDREVLTGAAAFLDEVRSREKVEGSHDTYHLYGYENRGGLTPRRSVIGCLCRMYIDVSPGDLVPTLDRIVEAKPPKWEDQDWYYWYYAMLLTFQVSKDRFMVWNKALRDVIVENQVKEGEFAGSWDPKGEFATWGRLFSTTMATLCLEVYYRYAPKDLKTWEGVK